MLSAPWREAALGVVLAVSTVAMVEQVGAEPGALAWGGALPLLAVALAHHLAARLPPVVRLVVGLVAALGLTLPQLFAELACVLGRTVHLSPSGCLLAFLSCWLIVCTLAQLPFVSAAPASPGRLATVVAFALLGWLLPAGPIVGLLVVAAFLAMRATERAAQPEDSAAFGTSLVSSLAMAVLVLLCAWGATSLWTSLRAFLDPTPLGWWTLANAAALALAAGWYLANLRTARIGLEPLAASLGVAVTLAALPLLVPWGSSRLPDLLFSYEAHILLPALLAAPAAFAALPLGLAAPSRTQGSVEVWPLVVAGGAGVVLGSHGGPPGAALLVLSAILGAAAVMLFAQRPVRRLVGLLAAMALSLLWWQLPPVQLTTLTTGWAAALTDEPTARRHVAALERSEWAFATWGPEGASSLRWVEDALVADIDGTPIWDQGRNPATVRFAAQLPALLAEDPSHFLVLGDELGLATITLLTHSPGTIDVAVAQPELVRAMASLDDGFRRALLAPEVQLHPVQSRFLLRHSEPVDGVLQILLRPWSDSGSVPLDKASLRLVRARLRPGGVFVAVVATSRYPAQELRSLFGAFADSFPAGAACLPPVGADHVLLVGTVDDELLPLARLVERFDGAAASLGALGITSALDVADRCVIPAAGLGVWTSEDPGRGRWPAHRLPSTISESLALPLATIGAHIGMPGEIWDMDGASDASEELGRRYQAVGHFLQLLGVTGSGDMKALFEHAKALQINGNGDRELDTLIAPHVARAREHMKQARRGGFLHRGWQQAINELTLARMLHPNAIEPRLLEAMVHEARGEPRSAEKLYRSVLASEEAHLPALFGLARVQTSEGREAEADATLVQATVAHPRDAAAFQALGVARLRTGRLDEAEPALGRAAALASPERAEPQAALAELYLAQERPRVALAHAERAVSLEPSAYHYTLLGRCHLDLEHNAAAERYFHQAVIIDSNFYPPRAGIAQILAERGDYTQAIEALNAVLQAEPGNQAALANLAELRRLQALEEAVPRLDIAP